MKTREILRRLSEIYGVPERELPKTIERFKKELDEMKTS